MSLLKAQQAAAEERFIEAAAMLRGTAPAEWDKFVSELQGIAYLHTVQLLQAQGEGLIRAQGAAQALQAHYEFLLNIRKKLEALRAQKSAQQGIKTL